MIRFVGQDADPDRPTRRRIGILTYGSPSSCPYPDGTRIPIFIAHKKGLKLDGTNPTLLYGYGGFDIPMTPDFRVKSKR